MRKLIILIFLMAIALPIFSRYSLHSISQGVKVEVAGKQSPASAGMTLKPSDQLIIPSGGKVEIYNDLDKKIYTSTAEGKITVTRLLIDARSAAADNRANVASKLRFGRKNDNGDQKLYVEKGMVRRSLGILDPEGEKIVADPSIIANFIATRFANEQDDLYDTFPVPMQHSATPEGGMAFDLRNTIGFPVYFNVVKITKKNDQYEVRISELGQPAGVYVLLPDQTMARGHFASVSDDEIHLMVMTHCQFDIDEMIEALDKSLRENPNPLANTSLPIYLMKL